MANLGTALLRGDFGRADVRRGLMWLRRAADAKSTSAMTELGVFYIKQSGARDRKTGERWLLAAAEGGSSLGQDLLITLYSHGMNGIPKSTAKAGYWRRRLTIMKRRLVPLHAIPEMRS
jgi:TPR repeat protein